MTKNYSFSGRVEWIGVRQKEGDIKSLDTSYAIEGLGLEGDKITKKSSKKRQVTLMQKEHISVILSLAKEEDQDKINKIQYYFKRNLLISKYNILNLKGNFFSIGEAKFFGTGDCKPCKKIENLLGKKMLDAMQGMGGITATVVKSGTIKINDSLNLESE
ncbi:MAG: MOSC domain-containing protein [Gammaproteobacteria bacterium]|jgi:MOSC domain-containing protein YiiM